MQFMSHITVSINKITLNIEKLYPKGMLAPHSTLVPEKLPLQICVSYAITVFAYCKLNHSHFKYNATPLIQAGNLHCSRFTRVVLYLAAASTWHTQKQLLRVRCRICYVCVTDLYPGTFQPRIVKSY